MFILNKLDQYKDYKIILYLDMDGTLCDYEVGIPYNYDKKRPLLDRINKIKKISNKVELRILTVCKNSKQENEKNKWLDIYLKEIPLENRIILKRDELGRLSSAVLKNNYLNNLNIESDTKVILIDDDPLILKTINKNNKNNVILLKDSVLDD